METLNTTYVLELLSFLENSPTAIIFSFLALWINVYFIRQIAVHYEIRSRICISRNKPNRVFFYYFLAIVFLMAIQMAVIIFWGLALNALSLIQDPKEAIRFAGSCYTTLGYFVVDLPDGWHFIPSVIALSGLFAIALATACMLNMSILFRQAWLLKHATKIKAILERENIQMPEFIEIQEIIKVKAEIKTTK
jgi:hypothetical protein